MIKTRIEPKKTFDLGGISLTVNNNNNNSNNENINGLPKTVNIELLRDVVDTVAVLKRYNKIENKGSVHRKVILTGLIICQKVLNVQRTFLCCRRYNCFSQTLQLNIWFIHQNALKV